MKKEDIQALIRREVPYTEELASELKGLLNEYPYFQTAQLLYTLNLQAVKDTEFPAELRKTATCLGDRRQLFYLVEEDFFSPVLIDSLEKEDEVQLGSPFDLIDFFLSERESKRTKGIASETAPKPISEIPEEPTKDSSDSQPVMQLVSTDYMSYILSEETQSVEQEVPQMQHQEAIDKFLLADKESPIKIQLKEGDAEPETFIPNLDSVDEESFFSETLAKIYLKQKKYDKALAIIRQLNLVYPEKNIYFADQIRFLEKLIINTNKIK